MADLFERVQAVEQVLESVKLMKADVDGIKTQIDHIIIESGKRTKESENDQTTSGSNGMTLRTEMTTAISKLKSQYTLVTNKSQQTIEKCETIEGDLHKCLKRLDRLESSLKDVTKSVTSCAKKQEEEQQKTNSQIEELKQELEKNMEEMEKRRNKRVSRLKDQVKEFDVTLKEQACKLVEFEAKVSTNVRDVNDLRSKLEVLSKTGKSETESVTVSGRDGVQKPVDHVKVSHHDTDTSSFQKLKQDTETKVDYYMHK